MLLSPKELMRDLNKPELRIVDCRFSLPGPGFNPDAGREAYAQSHIPGAVFFDLEKDLSAKRTPNGGRHPLPNAQSFAKRLGAAGIHPRSLVVAYDDSGNLLAARFWWMLHHWFAHPQVYLLDGGFSAWQEAGFPIQSEQVDPQARLYPASENNRTLCTTDEVASIAGGKSSCVLLDARAADRFAGENESIDPVAGHIPTAENLPCMQNLDAQKRFLPQPALRERFNALVEKAGGAENIVHYCGSGVTACHNLFAMDLAGFSGARLYPGSWSEWIGDSTKPIA